MPRYKFRNKKTGQVVDFEYPTKPTQEVVRQVFDYQVKHSKAKEAVQKVERQATESLTPFQKFSSSGAGQFTQDLLESVDPVTGLGKLAEGAKQVVTGTGFERNIFAGPTYAPGYTRQKEELKVNPPQYPRVQGAATALSGAMGVLSPSLPGAIIRKPLASAVALAGFEGARRGTHAVLPSSTPPEVGQLAEEVVGLAGGTAAGKAGGLFKRPPTPLETRLSELKVTPPGAKPVESVRSQSEKPGLKPVEEYLKETKASDSILEPKPEATTGSEPPRVVPPEQARTTSEPLQVLPGEQPKVTPPESIREPVAPAETTPTAERPVVEAKGTKPISERRKKGQKGAVIIPTGSIIRKVGTAKSYVRSADQYLDQIPEAKPIADNIRSAYYAKVRWMRDVFHEFERTAKGFKGKWEDVSDYMEGQNSNPTPDVKRVGDEWRKIFDFIHTEAVRRGATTRTGQPIGYLQDYLTHIMKDDTFGDLFMDAMKGLVGKKAGLKDKLFGTQSVSITSKAKGNPNIQFKPLPESPFVEPRTATIPNQLLVRDTRKIVRAYVDSMARMIFDKPAVLENRRIIQELRADASKAPLTDLAQWYNDHYAGLTKRGFGWKADRLLARVGARSVLPGSFRLQGLHAARVLVQIWPEVGTKGIVQGVNNLVRDWKGTTTRLRESGLLQQETVPSMFKTGMEKFDNLGNYYDIGNTIAKAISLEANRARLKAKGDPNWENNAILETARQEGVVNPAHPIRAQESVPRLIMQFKYWLNKYGENVTNAMADAAIKRDKESFAKFARYITAAVLAEELTRKSGVVLFHISGHQFENFFDSPMKDTIEKFVRNLNKGDLTTAFIELARGVTPAGRSIIGTEGRGANKQYKVKPPSLPVLTEYERKIYGMPPSGGSPIVRPPTPRPPQPPRKR